MLRFSSHWYRIPKKVRFMSLALSLVNLNMHFGVHSRERLSIASTLIPSFLFKIVLTTSGLEPPLKRILSKISLPQEDFVTESSKGKNGKEEILTNWTNTYIHRFVFIHRRFSSYW